MEASLRGENARLTPDGPGFIPKKAEVENIR
jgi:hypothetical protein